MTDDMMREFQKMDRGAQVVTLALEGFNPEKLEFEAWRVANGKDPEWRLLEAVEA